MAQSVLIIIRFRNGSILFKDLSTYFLANIFEKLSILKHLSHPNFTNVLYNFPEANAVLHQFLANRNPIIGI